MNWMIKVTIGMLLLAILLISLGVVVIRANEYRPALANVSTPKVLQEKTSIKPIKEDKNIVVDEKNKSSH